ncbi:S9 family peptidase [Natronospira bacteriovora]|uniref:Alpha/beta fold hydrolase n=1 Tax=Natronospira bacteriovora TaxID=3069753 RepID=A0ABU0W9W1_9GAMM|nr:alpha/beta fold hydrolase [Natronospira sp. AB-CW4]MDQ2070818.1 alpha/beta fold hydrolase [Natronospira sp. AB-CW4]
MSLVRPLFVLASFLLLPALAVSESRQQPLEWEAICAADVCRATGHDGVMGVSLSADGEELALSVDTPRHQGIHRQSVDSGDSEFWVEGHSPVWFPDGQGIVFIRDHELWRVARDSDRPRRLTRDDGDVRAPVISPDGKTIAFMSGRSGHQDVWLVDAQGRDEGRDEGREPARALTEGAMTLEEARFGLAWSPDGQSIAFISNEGDYWGDNLWVVDVATGERRQLSRSFMAWYTPSWSPDGERIAVMGADKAGMWYGDMADIYVVDVASGREQRVDMAVHAMAMDRPIWGPDGDELFFPVHERAELEWWRVPVDGGVATRVSNMGGLIHAYDASASGDRFVVVRSTSTRGREADLLTLEGGEPRTLTAFASRWPGVQEAVEISYRSFDGHYIQAFRFLPPGFDPGQSYPTLIQVHGGGTNSYFNGLNLVEQRLAQQGYVVLAVNYRGGSGFGRPFQDMAIEDWSNAQALDAAAAADWVRKQPWSSGKVGIYGYSYGGIISLAAVTRAPEAFDAAVPMGGIYDWAHAWEYTDRLGRILTADGHGGTPQERPETYRVSDSVRLLDQVQTPILIMHGEADTRAPFSQFELVVEALEQHDKVFESHSYPDEPHRYRRLENRVDMYERLETWMDRWLRE